MSAKLLYKAIVTATSAHHGQKRWDGSPYIEHPQAISNYMPDEDGKIVALLHDVIEDTDMTLQDLRNEGFPAHIINAVKAITHWDRFTYKHYLEMVIADPIARRVKIADITHNLVGLMTEYPEKVRNIKKYKMALDYLI